MNYTLPHHYTRFTEEGENQGDTIEVVATQGHGAVSTGILGAAIGFIAAVQQVLATETALVITAAVILTVLAISAFGLVLGLMAGALISALFLLGLYQKDELPLRENIKQADAGNFETQEGNASNDAVNGDNLNNSSIDARELRFTV